MTNAQLAKQLRSAASALEHGRHSTVTKKLAPIDEVYKALARLADYLAEAHAAELETCHAGDEIHSGPAPESCSYCNAIDEARLLIESRTL